MGQAYTTPGTNKSLGTKCTTDAECMTVNGIKAGNAAYVCCLKTRLVEFGPTKDAWK